MLAERVEAIARAADAGDVPGMVAADMDFHTALSALSGHDLLIEHLAAIQRPQPAPAVLQRPLPAARPRSWCSVTATC